MHERTILKALSLCGLVVLAPGLPAATILSDGSDGAFNGGGTVMLDADGVFNFTTITVPLGATLRIAPNATNTPAVLAATGDVVIDGTIDVSAGHFSPLAFGPGGGAGGANGHGAASGQSGTGLSPGHGGQFPGGGVGNAGGGGGMATPGLVATSRTNSSPAAGGAAIGYPGPVGGSGGGGGSGWVLFGVELDGGGGGAAGGGLLITTPGSIIVNGSILANGGHAVWGFANVFGFGGPGGGGSGGNLMLEASGIALGSSALLSAIGGAGGGLGTEPVAWDPFLYSNGAHGGRGYVMWSADSIDIDPGATINAEVVPVPAAAWLFLTGLGGLALAARGRQPDAGGAPFPP